MEAQHRDAEIGTRVVLAQLLAFEACQHYQERWHIAFGERDSQIGGR
jgi:hypothetical protein